MPKPTLLIVRRMDGNLQNDSAVDWNCETQTLLVDENADLECQRKCLAELKMMVQIFSVHSLPKLIRQLEQHIQEAKVQTAEL